MFDERMRQMKDAGMRPLARRLQSLPPWSFTIIGLALGIGAAAALWQQRYGLGFGLWFCNRLFDGLDGVVARLRGAQSDFGGYLDILVDFVVYALIPVGLAAGAADRGVTASLIFLLCTYYVNAASWMYLAAILEKRQAAHAGRLTTVAMPAGIIGGTETIVFYSAFMIFPAYLVWLFTLMGLLIVVTILQRLWWAAHNV